MSSKFTAGLPYITYAPCAAASGRAEEAQKERKPLAGSVSTGSWASGISYLGHFSEITADKGAIQLRSA